MINQKLLIIDDSPDIHELVTLWLADEPLEFFSCATGMEGVAEVARLSPDLVLLDVDLPDVDGFEVCRRLKADAATASIPIVFLTGASSTDEKLCGLELGAVDYVTKPFDPAELRARVRISLRTKALVDMLSRKAMVDGLTGLFNRAYFDQSLAQHLSSVARGGNPFACMLIDIDHFKSINDRFGHPFGDRVLRSVAAELASDCRQQDIVCRYGGEEFVFLTPGQTIKGAQVLAERKRVAIEQIPFSHEGRPVQVTCSIGVSDTTAGPPHEVVASADACLYQAKNSGRNRVVAAGEKASLAA
jgi:diguanylate cyclase (GGDEF)-like protein